MSTTDSTRIQGADMTVDIANEDPKYWEEVLKDHDLGLGRGTSPLDRDGNPIEVSCGLLGLEETDESESDDE